MTNFWQDMEQLFKLLAEYNDVAVVHFEPDWWGYVEQASKGNPTQLPAQVKLNARCAMLGDDAAGMARCIAKSRARSRPKSSSASTTRRGAPTTARATPTAPSLARS